jgi:hypothetical protein
VPVLRRHFAPERIQMMEMNRGLFFENDTPTEAQPEDLYAGVC